LSNKSCLQKFMTIFLMPKCHQKLSNVEFRFLTWKNSFSNILLKLINFTKNYLQSSKITNLTIPSLNLSDIHSSSILDILLRFLSINLSIEDWSPRGLTNLIKECLQSELMKWTGTILINHTMTGPQSIKLKSLEIKLSQWWYK